METKPTTARAWKRLSNSSYDDYSSKYGEHVYITVRQSYWTDRVTITVTSETETLRVTHGTRRLAEQLGSEVDAAEQVIAAALCELTGHEASYFGEIPLVLADNALSGYTVRMDAETASEISSDNDTETESESDTEYETMSISALETWRAAGLMHMSASIVIGSEAEYDEDGEALNVYDAVFVHSPFGWCWHSRPVMACSQSLRDMFESLKNGILDDLYSGEEETVTIHA